MVVYWDEQRCPEDLNETELFIVNDSVLYKLTTLSITAACLTLRTTSAEIRLLPNTTFFKIPARVKMSCLFV